MEEVKISTLISYYAYVVGSMRLLKSENQTIEKFACLLLKYNSIKNKLVSKSSIRIVIDDIEYKFAVKREQETKLDWDGEIVEPEFPEDNTNLNWEDRLTDGIIRSIIINHYINQI